MDLIGKLFLKLIAAVGFLICAPAMSSPLDSNISYKEKIELHDGTSAYIFVSQDYHKITLFSGDENTYRQRLTVKFTPDEASAEITFTTHLAIVALDRMDSNWYIVIAGIPFKNYPDEPIGKWGESWTPLGQRVAKLQGREFIPINWKDVPPNFLTVGNINSNYLTLADLRRIDGKTFKLEDARKFIANRPSNYLRILRPQQQKIPE